MRVYGREMREYMHSAYLIASPRVFNVIMRDGLCNLATLLFDCHQNIAALVVESCGGTCEVACVYNGANTFCSVIVADATNDVADNLLIVKVAATAHFAKHENHSRLDGAFHGDAAHGILTQCFVHDCVADLIANLVGMALSDALAGEEKCLCAIEAGGGARDVATHRVSESVRVRVSVNGLE